MTTTTLGHQTDQDSRGTSLTGLGLGLPIFCCGCPSAPSAHGHEKRQERNAQDERRREFRTGNLHSQCSKCPEPCDDYEGDTD